MSLAVTNEHSVQGAPDDKLQTCGALADAIEEILVKCDTKTTYAIGYKFLVGANNTDGGSAFVDATPCVSPLLNSAEKQQLTTHRMPLFTFQRNRFSIQSIMRIRFFVSMKYSLHKKHPVATLPYD